MTPIVPVPGDPASGREPVLTVDGLSVALDGRLVLHDVSMQVNPGEFVVVLGANGSGKSTLVRAAVGLVPAIGGAIRLFGEPLDHFNDRARLGYVPQRTGIVGGVPATVGEVVASGRLPRRHWFRRLNPHDRDIVDRALVRVDLQDRRTSPLSDLSGGQRQRALIARALATEADLLIMDEPTAGVDHDRQHDLADLLKSLVNDGMSVLMVAHELGPMAPLVDRAIVLAEGRIRYDGPTGSQLDHAVGHTEHSHLHSAAPVHEGLPSEGAWG